jgi:hypothetical protein
VASTAHHCGPGRRAGFPEEQEIGLMFTFLLWLLLLVVAWPLALLALILYPLVWLLSLPLRLVGISVKAVLDLVWSIISLPARVLRGPKALRSR